MAQENCEKQQSMGSGRMWGYLRKSILPWLLVPASSDGICRAGLSAGWMGFVLLSYLREMVLFRDPSDAGHLQLFDEYQIPIFGAGHECCPDSGLAVLEQTNPRLTEKSEGRRSLRKRSNSAVHSISS